MLESHIEEAGLKAWPALQEVLYDGWVLRFAQGYTKRANSINPLYSTALELEEKITHCEQLYARQGLPAIFRLNSFATPPGLDEMLAARHYQMVEPSLILYLDLKAKNQLPVQSTVRVLALDEWLKLFCRLKEAEVAQHQIHRSMLEKITGKTCFVALVEDNTEVACGIGVLEDGCFGIFDLVTDPARRKKGYGTKLVSWLLHWAQENEASHAYLQVVAANTPARQLYTKLGFEELYNYWYRCKE